LYRVEKKTAIAVGPKKAAKLCRKEKNRERKTTREEKREMSHYKDLFKGPQMEVFQKGMQALRRHAGGNQVRGGWV